MANLSTITVDRIRARAMELTAIADALYEAGFRKESAVLAEAAASTNLAAASVAHKIAAQAAAMLKDDEDSTS